MAAPTDVNANDLCPCDDILRFNKALQNFRQSDDRFIYKLNSMLPTQSFKERVNPKKECEQLFHQMVADYNSRERSIQRCIGLKKAEIHELLQKQAANKDDTSIKRDLNTATLLFQKELPQELILRDRSFKLFYEKCADFYQPS
ncbi:protein MIX23-like isoform X2 [Dreissena polymorpha]|uniref:protein MIX23-like isoform X2 n=1 Tax=Dreissena polymorpha TaxID=45954 RepID=UPI00226520D5|nr:protein MIX23-like isoform X2 [Dreissena polymorpha]